MSSDLEAAISRAIAQGLSHTEAAALLKAEGHDVSRWTVSRRARRAAGEPSCEVVEMPSGEIPVQDLLERRIVDFRRKKLAREARDRIPLKVNVEGPIGIAFMGDPHCLTDDHEILTERGWIQEHEISDHDLVAGTDPEGRFVWQSISRIIRRDIDEEIVVVKGEGISLACTIAHRVLCQRMGGGVYNQRKFELAGDLDRNQLRIPVAAWASADGEADLSDDEIRLLAWILTDTSWLSWSGRLKAFRIYQGKPQQVAQIRDLLDRLGLHFSEACRDREFKHSINGRPVIGNHLEFSFYLGVDVVPGLINRLGLNSKTQIPEASWQFSRRQFDLFLATVVEADGDYPSKNVVRVTKSLEFLDQLQALAAKHGYKTLLRSKDGAGWGCLSLSGRDHAVVKPKSHFTRTWYKGRIWCVTVDHGNFFTRREGMVHITGNCDSDGTDVETLFRHADLLASNDAILSINLGDSRNCWVGRLARLYGEQGTTAKQAWALTKHFLERARFNVILLGNHDQWLGADDPIAPLFKGTNTLVEPNQARLDFQLPGGRSVLVHVSHDFPGQTMYNPAHGAVKKAKFDNTSHIFACGHLHTFGYQPVWHASSKTLSHAIRVASYKVYDSYADSLYLDHGLPVVCPVALVDPRWPDSSPNFVRWELDPEEAVERLRWMRAKA